MSQNWRSAFEEQLKISKEFLKSNDRIPDSPYTTFYHRDLWMKNIMIKRGIKITCILLYSNYDYAEKENYVLHDD